MVFGDGDVGIRVRGPRTGLDPRLVNLLANDTKGPRIFVHCCSIIQQSHRKHPYLPK